MITQPAPRMHPGDTAGTRPSLRLVPRDPSLDPALAAVQAAHTMLGIDASWSLANGRGFTWRVGGLVQRVWAELARPGDAQGGRVLAETEIVRDVQDHALAAEMANLLNGLGSMGALVADPMRGTIVHRTGAWIPAGPGTDPGAAHRFAVATRLQASEAGSIAELLASSTRGAVARPLHPGFAARIGGADPVTLDDILAAGREPSRWADGGLLHARRGLAQGARARMVAADALAFTMPIPFLGGLATLQATTSEPHPVLGSGLRVRLLLSIGAVQTPDATTAAELNRLEAAAAVAPGSPTTDLQGAWIAATGRLQHVAFLPNAAHTSPDGATAVLRSALARAAWAEHVLG